MSRELIKATVDRQYAPWGITLPDDFDRDSAPRSIGTGGWTINVRFLPESGGVLEVFSSHRMTEDRLDRIESDGSVTSIATPQAFIVHRAGEDSTVATESYHARNRAFYETVADRGLLDEGTPSMQINAALRMGLSDE